MDTSKAVQILRQELETTGSVAVNQLSIRVKWGQKDLAQLGAIGVFLQKHPEVFAFENQIVTLVHASGPTSKAKAPSGGPKAPGILHSAPLGSKAAPPPPPAMPRKRGWDGDAEPQAVSKASAGANSKFGGADAGDKGNGKGEKGKGGGYNGESGAATSKAKSMGAPAPDQGKGKGDKGKDLGAKQEVLHSDGQEAWAGFALSPQERKLALQSDSLLSSQAQTGIEAFKTNGVDIELGMLSKKLVPSDEARRNAQGCLALARSAISSQHSGPNAPSLELCGSYAQGTEVNAAAIDLALRLSPNLSFDERSHCVSELRSHLSQQNSLEVHDTSQHYPHTTSPMAIELKDTGLVAHILLEEQRVNRPPTLDAVIKQLCDSFAGAYDLIRLVKIWSVNHGLTNFQEGFMSGVGWTVLAIFFMQKQKLIPPYSVISQGAVTPATMTTSLSTLLQHFFEFLAHLAPHGGLSLWQGQEFEGPPTLFIEDPAHFLETRQQRSLSEKLGEAQWARVQEEAKKAVNRIKVRPARWFHWAEVFDPTDRKPTKIHGLAAHLTLPLEAAGTGMDAKGGGKGTPDVKGKGKDFDDKGSGKGAKDADGKGGKDVGKGFGAKDEGKGFGAKDHAKGNGKDLDGKGSAKDGGFAAKDDGKGYGKESDKGWSKDGGKDKGGKDDGKGYGKSYDGKGYGKDYAMDDGKGYGYGGYGKDSGKGKSWGKPY